MSSHSVSDKDTFLRAVQAFSAQLDTATDFNSIHDLWRGTSLPYAYDSTVPLSDAYRDEVLALYRQLTATDYAVDNEMTSTKQSAAQFEAGYPWTSGNLQVVAEEYMKVSQALRAIHAQGKGASRIIEFGSGWGNLAIPLAKSGQAVTVVDIDQGFLARLQRVAEKEGVAITSLHGDFVAMARAVTQRYDFAVFQASFHHCLNFVELIAAIRDHVLTPEGSIVFLSEPIFPGYPFPWGLRFDGESLWAITRNKWLELGFDHDFFVSFMLRSGFLVGRIAGIPGLLGEGWLARPAAQGLPFEDCSLPLAEDATFHWSEPGTGLGRFCRAESRLPSLAGTRHSAYRLVLRNYGNVSLHVSMRGSGAQAAVDLSPGGSETIVCEAAGDPLEIRSDVFSPKEQGLNEDTRRLGAAIHSIALQ